MNQKRIFGAIFTSLGTIGLIYSVVFFATASGNNQDVRILIAFGVTGIVFLSSGISLIGDALREKY